MLVEGRGGEGRGGEGGEEERGAESSSTFSLFFSSCSQSQASSISVVSSRVQNLSVSVARSTLAPFSPPPHPSPSPPYIPPDLLGHCLHGS